jgi:hypothetical protein
MPYTPACPGMHNHLEVGVGVGWEVAEEGVGVGVELGAGRVGQ